MSTSGSDSNTLKGRCDAVLFHQALIAKPALSSRLETVAV
jgi:hypothetical protein